jgi:hypothetical protein
MKTDVKKTWAEGGERPAETATAEPKRAKAADPTASAKKAAARVRRCASELTEALKVAHDAGLSVQLRVGQLDLEDEHDSDAVVEGRDGRARRPDQRERNSLSKPMVPPIDRFLRAIAKSPSPGCWRWTRGKTAFGYGIFHVRVRGTWKKVGAHRFSYEHFIGPVPKGPQVCHHCDNPACVNPAHLYVGTQKQNVRDCVARGRNVNANKRQCRNGHPCSDENTYTLKRGACTSSVLS